MTIRKARINDIEIIKKMMLSALMSDPTAFTVDHKEYSHSTDSWWRLYLNDYLIGINASLYFAFDDNDEVVGMVGVTFNKRKRMSHVASIVWFYVVKEKRNQGIGKKLISFLIENISSLKHIKKINLTVISAQEKAIAMYKNFNFKIVGTQKDEIRIENKYYDFITMERKLE